MAFELHESRLLLITVPAICSKMSSLIALAVDQYLRKLSFSCIQ
jgi:hypothetical protein